MEYKEIVLRTKEILSRPVHSISEEKFNEIHYLYFERNQRLMSLFGKAKSVIPGGVEHNRS